MLMSDETGGFGMKLASEKSIQALEYAARREDESLKFYSECLDKAKLPGTAAILSGLVDDEKKHKAMVEKLLAAARKALPVKDIAAGGGGAAETRMKEAFPHAMAEDAGFAAESESVREILEKALANEKESFNNYAAAAEDADEDEVRGIFTFLAREENIHYNLVGNLVSYLADPGTWLYEEENLVFRRG